MTSKATKPLEPVDGQTIGSQLYRLTIKPPKLVRAKGPNLEAWNIVSLTC